MHEGTPLLEEARLEAQLLDTLDDALWGLTDVEVKAVRGCALIDLEEIDISFIPEGKKVTLTYEGTTDTAPVLYYAKTDAHSPEPFQMPARQLASNEACNVSGFGVSSNGLVIAVSDLRGNHNYFYTTSLDDVRLEVVDKNDAERAEELMHGVDLKFHDDAVTEIDNLSAQLGELVNRIDQLPKFDIDSPFRYFVDLFGGGTLYTLNDDGTLTKLDEFGGPIENVRHGSFYGNRVEIIDGKIILVDDETNTGLGTYYYEARKKHFGFLYFKPVDASARR
jgi:hypothetical protein